MSNQFRDFLKSHLSPSVRGILRGLKGEIDIAIIHNRGFARGKAYRGRKNLKLNCGCGAHLKKGWVNIDLCDGADLQLDLRRTLPFDDSSVDEIYSEHFFEHLQYPEEVGSFLNESLRVLAPGGIFHVRVPDMVLFLKAYLNGDSNFFEINSEFWRNEQSKTLMQCLNTQMRGGHKYCYDFETLSDLLAQHGFVSIERVEFDENLDSAYHRHETLYVRACKPA